MAGSRVKGITIDIDGDTKGLDKALSSVNSSARKTQTELRDVNKLLKLDPSNVELVSQKQKLLGQAVEQTGEKLKQLKSAQAQVEAQFRSGDIGETQYRAFQREVAQTESQLKSYKGQIQTTESEQTRLSSATKTLGNFFTVTKSKVEDFRGVIGDRLVNAYNSGTASADDMERVLSKISKDSGVAGSSLQELAKKVNSIDDGADVDKVRESIKQLGVDGGVAGEQLKKITEGSNSEKWQNMADGAVNAKDNIVNFSKSAMDAWSETDEAVDNLTSKTGATGKAADKLASSYKAVITSMPISDTKELSDTLAGLNSRFGLTGDALTQSGTKMEEFSKVTGQNGAEAVEGIHDAMGKFNLSAKEMPSVLDAFTAASQRSGVPVADLEQSASKAAPTFKELHINLQNGVGILAAWQKGGVDADTALRGMTKASVNYAKEGKSLKDGLTDTFNAIKNAKNPQDALNASVEAFGAKSGPQMSDAIKDGKVSLDDLQKSVKGTGGQLSASYKQTLDPSDKLKVSQQQMKEAMAEVGGAIQSALLPIMQTLGPIIKGVGEEFSKMPGPIKTVIVAFGGIAVAIGFLAPLVASIGTVVKAIKDWGLATKIVSAATKVWSAVQAAFNIIMDANPISLIIIAIAAIIAIIAIVITKMHAWGDVFNFIKDIASGLGSFFSGLWSGIQQVFTSAVSAIGSFLTGAWNGIVNVITMVWSGVTGFFSGLWNGISSVFSSVVSAIGGFLSGAWNGISGVITSVWSGISGFFSGLWNGISGIFNSVVGGIGSFLSGAWNGMKSVVSSVWNGIKGIFNTVIGAISSFINSEVNGWRNIFSAVLNAIKGIVSGFVNGVKSVFNGIKEVGRIVGDAFNSVKDKASSILNGVWNFIKGVIDKIKSAFNFHISFPEVHIPKIKLPHFSLSGDFDPLKGKLPKIGIDWYAKGGVFNKPTLFATNSGMKGVGEAGPEAVLPLNDDTLGGIGKGIAKAMGNQKQQQVQINQNFYVQDNPSEYEAARQLKNVLKSMAYKAAF
ncbi:MAG: phage tail tape measure protein [Lactobacillaceae bacterium]|jgi:TP901 family phage tail tape measure protein|nr:phage tail tape measure protein [Lactobacillaceae bacterium]